MAITQFTLTVLSILNQINCKPKLSINCHLKSIITFLISVDSETIIQIPAEDTDWIGNYFRAF